MSLISAKYQVTVIVANIKQFRSVFYSKLASELNSHDIRLKVIYSEPYIAERSKNDSVNLSEPLGEKVARIYMLKGRLLLQFPSVKDLKNSDLIIIVQSSGYILNYLILLLSCLHIKRVAFWGHGFNRQSNSLTLSERIKRKLARQSDWWFAYTSSTKKYLLSIGVASNKITTIENAIDTNHFKKLIKSIRLEEIIKLKRQLGIHDDEIVGLYCGSIYSEKRISYLIQASLLIVNREPKFRLVIIGSGPEVGLIENYSTRYPFIIYAGSLFGRDKAIIFKMAAIFLNPGLVGLGILDAFAAGLPFVTTAEAKHSPEIDYLENGINGLIVSGDEKNFADSVNNLLNNPLSNKILRDGAKRAANKYTIENMVVNVKRGILDCLKISVDKPLI